MLFRSLVVVFLLGAATRVHATWSVVAVDPVIGEVGVAVLFGALALGLGRRRARRLGSHVASAARGVDT